MPKHLRKHIVRIIALFVFTVLDAIGGAALIGQKAAVGAAIAGIMALATVAKSLAKAAMEDGEISDQEIDEAIDEVLKKKK